VSTPRPQPARQPSYIPPQPVRRGPSRNLVVAGIVIALVAIVLGAIAVNIFANGPTGGAPEKSTAIPTLTATGSPRSSSLRSPLVTSQATLAPSFVVVVGPSPGTPEAELLAHVPEALGASCTSQTAASSPPIYMASCSASGSDITVNYSAYASAELMNAAYQAIFTPLQIDPNSGSCENASTWPAESTYEVEDTPTGRRLCTDQPGAPTIYWTDERLSILSQASGADATQLLDFWTNEAGPIP
jgi:hypothetical protein